MTNQFEILLWDVDQTLLDFDRSQDYALRYSFKEFGMEADERIVSHYAAINDAYWKLHERGEVTKDELLLGRFEKLFQELGILQADVRDFALVYQKALGSVYYFRDDAYQLCSKLKGRVRQYAVTNGVSATQRNKLHLSGLDQVLDDIFVSEEIGYPKPCIEYFDRCFQKILDFEKDKAIIIGDSLSSDIKGGNAAGISCCWYNPYGQINDAGLKIDFEITDLWEVEEILSGQIC